MANPPTSFHSLPSEIRMRILHYTHLGLPETGGYDTRLDRLRIGGGKLIPRGDPLMGPYPEAICASPVTHSTSKPLCQCRILPMQLFRVDRQMYREAVEVFYSSVCFEFYENDFGKTLVFLRNLPSEGLMRLQRIVFSITEAQCEGWGDGAVACGLFDATTYEGQIAIPYWGGGPPPNLNYKADWDAVVDFLASHTDLSRLSITVDMGEGSWPFVEETLMWPEHPDLSGFRFLYDLYMDIATALCALKGLAAVSFKLGAFEQLQPWLEREVLGYSPEPTFQTPHEEQMWQRLWQRPRWYQHIPHWHDMDRRLRGSNYRP